MKIARRFNAGLNAVAPSPAGTAEKVCFASAHYRWTAAPRIKHLAENQIFPKPFPPLNLAPQ